MGSGICSGVWGCPENDERRSTLTFDEEGLAAYVPAVGGRIAYSIKIDQPLRGVPIRESKIYHIATEDKIDYCTLSLYINGFSFFLNTDELRMSVSMNPFALVRNCKFQSQLERLHEFKIFKIAMFPQASCYYFGVDEDEERSRWVLDISHILRLLTQSLFPPFKIRTSPLRPVPTTNRRLMAGYLLYAEEQMAVLVYCELHAHIDEKAKVVLYENESCMDTIREISITESSICCEKVGINCSCFCIEDHIFSSRTLSERKLWLRAISNVKVKIQNRAPSPSKEDLKNYRRAINEHLDTLMERVELPLSMDPLLQQILI